MSEAVQQAREWANNLVLGESRGPGDLPRAMDRIERRYGVSRNLLWSLRYRPPKDIMVGAYTQLRAAYIAECERQERLYRHEREIAEARGNLNAIDKALIGAAAFVAGEKEET